MLEGLASLAENTAPNAEEKTALDLLFTLAQTNTRVFIVPATAKILEKWHDDVAEVHDLRQHVEIIVSARYWRRWARRLQAFGFTREDARVLSLGTFGTDSGDSFLGADQVFTFDKSMVTLFQAKLEQIQKKLDVMKQDIEPPYNEAKLPILKLLGGLLRNKK